MGRHKLPAIKAHARLVRELMTIADASGMTQREIGDLAGYGQADISALRTGRAVSPRINMLEDVAQVLGYRIQLVPLAPRK